MEANLKRAYEIVAKHHNKRTEQQRCRKQGEHFQRMIIVHRATAHLDEVGIEVADRLAATLGITQRSVYRIVRALKAGYELLGTTDL